MDLTGPERESRNSMGLPPHAWRAVSLAPHRLLMLDLDGTLVPFAIARDHAVPAPETLSLLERIAATGATTLAVISGRPLTELSRALGHPTWTLFGEHGWEMRDGDGPVVRHALPPGVATILDRAEQVARAEGFGDRLERKRTSVAVHTRGLDTGRAGEIESAVTRSWTPLAAQAPMRPMPFDGGVELRVTGRDKGVAVRELLARERPRTLAVYVGDDRTDEDAFAALPPDGIGVRVGALGVSSTASVRFETPEDVARFLARWLEVTEESERTRA